MIRELRHQKIIELVTQQQGITVQELTNYLKVSAMTIHRDLQLLEEQGIVQRVRGGVVTGTQKFKINSQKESCGYCGKACSPRTRLTLFSDSGETILACCVHCGMGLIQKGNDLKGGLGVDFLYETVVDLPGGYYLFQPQIKICCSPGVLVFADRQDAERMQQGFGGKLLNFEELLKSFGVHRDF
ncbi:MAG: hypothetical protein KatS3mg047_0833 [Bellilinea sp.]|nr:MAG: hypothetical protein KatS3mg047_0833 [Bellilinea sp.]